LTPLAVHNRESNLFVLFLPSTQVRMLQKSVFVSVGVPLRWVKKCSAFESVINSVRVFFARTFADLEEEKKAGPTRLFGMLFFDKLSAVCSYTVPIELTQFFISFETQKFSL